DIEQLQRSHIAVLACMSARNDARAAFASANLESGSILRERIERRAVRVLEIDRYEEQRGPGKFAVHISNAFQIELIPVMGTFARRIALIFVFDPIAERVFRSRQAPFENSSGVRRIRHGGGIGPKSILG